MTEAELVKLLDVARRRPLLDAVTVRVGDHKGVAMANLRPSVIAKLKLLARERALIYKTLILTGLRKSELASLTVGQLCLDGANAYSEMRAADEKNREGSQIALRQDLAADLVHWIKLRCRRCRWTEHRSMNGTWRGQPEPTTRSDAN